MDPEEASIIQQIIAPAAMIPACGLLLLSSTARMNTLLARIRAFHNERLTIWAAGAEEGSRAGQVRALRLVGLEHQTHRLLGRVRLLRLTMLQLLAAVACNLLAVVGLALRFVVDDTGGTLYLASAGVFILGIVIMLGSMATSLLEVWRIIETVLYEHGRVERLCGVDEAPSQAPTQDPVLGGDSGEGMGL